MLKQQRVHSCHIWEGTMGSVPDTVSKPAKSPRAEKAACCLWVQACRSTSSSSLQDLFTSGMHCVVRLTITHNVASVLELLFGQKNGRNICLQGIKLLLFYVSAEALQNWRFFEHLAAAAGRAARHNAPPKHT